LGDLPSRPHIKSRFSCGAAWCEGYDSVNCPLQRGALHEAAAVLMEELVNLGGPLVLDSLLARRFAALARGGTLELDHLNRCVGR
jgi:hypothetical protein